MLIHLTLPCLGLCIYGSVVSSSAVALRSAKGVKGIVQVRAYKVKSWDDPVDFLTQLARNSGKLLRGGEPDLNTAARMVLYDWQRGKIPYFALPPDYQDKGSALDKARRPSQAVTVRHCCIPAICAYHMLTLFAERWPIRQCLY